MCSKCVVLHNQKIKNVNKSALTGRKYTKPSKIITYIRLPLMNLTKSTINAVFKGF